MSKIRLAAGLGILFAAAAMRADTLGNPIVSNGYVFTNFDLPNGGNQAGSGTNINGIANNGNVVGFSISNNGDLSNYVRQADGTVTALNGLAMNAMALGINSAGDVVGQQNSAAFFLAPGGTVQTLAVTPQSAALGINDQGNVVGQYNTGPGFFLSNSQGNHVLSIQAPGAGIVNAQGINDKGLIVGFYLGADGQDHGFEVNVNSATNGLLMANAIADPAIPNVPGEPGATFVFSQVLGVNDGGMAVGYYQDSTASQHGFLYNTNTGGYTFLDDPAEQFSNGVEITQITGINNSGEITGFYSNGNGAYDGFVACPVGVACPGAGMSAAPEPASWTFASLGLALAGVGGFFGRRWRGSGFRIAVDRYCR